MRIISRTPTFKEWKVLVPKRPQTCNDPSARTPNSVRGKEPRPKARAWVPRSGPKAWARVPRPRPRSWRHHGSEPVPPAEDLSGTRCLGQGPVAQACGEEHASEAQGTQPRVNNGRNGSQGPILARGQALRSRTWAQGQEPKSRLPRNQGQVDGPRHRVHNSSA